MNKKTAILDLTGCDDINELHKRIKSSLDFPEYYGENLDAFWDCINRDCDIDFVTVMGVESVSQSLRSTVKQILEMFEENKKEWKNTVCPFDYKVVS